MSDYFDDKNDKPEAPKNPRISDSQQRLIDKYRIEAEKARRSVDTPTKEQIRLDNRVNRIVDKRTGVESEIDELDEKISQRLILPAEGYKERDRLQKRWMRINNRFKDAEQARWDEERAHRQTHHEAFRSRVERVSGEGMNLSQMSSMEKAAMLHRASNMVSSGEVNEASLSQTQKGLREEIEADRSALIERASDPNKDPLKIPDFARSLEEKKEYFRLSQAAEEVIKKKGLDTESVYKKSEALKEKILADRQNKGIIESAASGKYGSLKDEESKLKDLADRFLEAHEKFTASLDESPEVIEKFKGSLQEASKALDDQKKIVDAISKTGGGNGKIADALAMGARGYGVLYQAAGVYSDATVGSENQQISNRAAFANIVNQRFMTRYQAITGNMSALEEIGGQLFDESINISEEQRGQAGTAATAKIVGAAGETILGVGADVLSGRLGEAFSRGVSGAEKTAAAAIDVERQLSASQGAQGGYVATAELNKATSMIPGFIKDMYKDRGLALYQGTIGLGGASSGMYSALQSSAAGLGREFGVTAEELSGLTSIATHTVGAGFRELSDSGRMGVIRSALQAEKYGITSSQDYMQRLGQMTNVGGSNRELEDIMANAVARGVDDAKSFGDMVDSIINLSSASANQGVDVTGTMTRAMLAGTEFSKTRGVENENLRRNLTQRGIAAIEGITGASGLSFANMMEQAEITNQFGNIDPFTRTNIEKMTLVQSMELRQAAKTGDVKKLRSMSGTLGLQHMFFDDSGNLKENALQTAERMTLTQQATIRGEAMNVPKEVVDRMLNDPKSLTADDMKYLPMLGFTQEGLVAAQGGDFSKMTPGGPTGERAGALEFKGAAAGNQQDLINKFAENNITMGKLAEAMNKAAEKFDANAEAIKAQKAATEMKLDTATFNTAATTLKEAADKLLLAVQGKSAPEVKQELRRMTDSRGRPLPNTTAPAKPTSGR